MVCPIPTHLLLESRQYGVWASCGYLVTHEDLLPDELIDTWSVPVQVASKRTDADPCFQCVHGVWSGHVHQRCSAWRRRELVAIDGFSVLHCNSRKVHQQCLHHLLCYCRKWLSFVASVQVDQCIMMLCRYKNDIFMFLWNVWYDCRSWTETKNACALWSSTNIHKCGGSSVVFSYCVD